MIFFTKDDPMGIFEDFNDRRTQGNNKVMQQDFLPYKRFYNLDTNTYKDGALSSKQKHLIGLSGSLILRCNDCVLYHLEQAKQTGATREELNEAMNISLVTGGSVVIPELRKALAAMDELFNIKQ